MNLPAIQLPQDALQSPGPESPWSKYNADRGKEKVLEETLRDRDRKIRGKETIRNMADEFIHVSG